MTTIRRTITILKRTKREAAFSSTEGNQPWYWHITLGNGEIVAQGEEYENKEDLITMLSHLFLMNSAITESLRDFHHVTIDSELPE